MPIPIKEMNNDTSELSAKMRIFNTVKKWIIKGQLKPLEKLDDTEIAKYFSVSRTPVRESFQLLEMKKLIKSSPGRATFVTEIEFNNIDNLYLPLISLQSLAVISGIGNFSTHDIVILKDINEQFKEAIRLKDTDRILEKDQDFHKYLIQLSNNPYIIDFCDTLMDHTLRIEFLFFKNTPDLTDSYQEHLEIIDSLERRDTISSPILMKKHWERTVLLVKTLIEQGIN